MTIPLPDDWVLAFGRQETFTALAIVATLATLALLLVTVRSERRRAAPEEEVEGRAVPVGDARGALELVGSALAATHDPRALMPVILRATVDATVARGGLLVDDGVEVARIGAPLDEGGTLVFELGENTVLELYAPAGGFGGESRELAEWLASQAAIALENARLHAVVRRQAETDELTGLVNRRRFMEALRLEVARTDRSAAPLCVVLADLDDFKRVNDRYGHAAGDDFLQAFAATLGAHVRDIDVAARLGGEEFAILLPETDLGGAAAVAERLRAALTARPVAVAGAAITVSASFGVAEYEHGERPSELLRRADAALYRAKAEGKNRVARAAERSDV